ncbi:MAG: PHP domain-containing protein, partial [Peptostreptococcaceae bacterium]
MNEVIESNVEDVAEICSGIFSTHTHTEYSNLRMRDSIVKIEDAMDRAYELGYCGMAMTDHETVSGAVRAIKHYYKKYSDTPFKLALGNEIYLVDDINHLKENGGKYHHFILIAKNEKGWGKIRELSSKAWENHYTKGVERVPLEKSQLEDILKGEKGNLIATSACMGGQLGQLAARYIASNFTDNNIKLEIHRFITWCIETFGKDDFYVELAPSLDEDQILYNKFAI